MMGYMLGQYVYLNKTHLNIKSVQQKNFSNFLSRMLIELEIHFNTLGSLNA